MKLKELWKDIEILACTADPETEITAVCYDSRKASPGCLFVAVGGFATDGNRFIPMAMEKGAAAVVTAKKPETEVPYILVKSDRLALALLGCNFYGNPAKSMTMIGITGTNGKTSSTLHHGEYDGAGGHSHRAHHPGKPGFTGSVRPDAGRGLHPCGDGGFQPRDCPGAHRRRAL